MAFRPYARFQEPADEPDFSGVVVDDIDICEIDLSQGVFLPIELLASFEWDFTGWRVTSLYVNAITRAIVGSGVLAKTFETEDYFQITDKPEWKAISDAAKRWADARLNPEDYL